MAKGFSYVRIRVRDDVSLVLLGNLRKQVYDCLRNKMIPIVAYQANDFKVAP